MALSTPVRLLLLGFLGLLGLIALLCLIFVVLFYMSGDYSIRLPNNYDLTRVYASAIHIGHPTKGIVINAHINSYKVINDTVIGHVTLAEYSPEKEMSKPGYFILNTRTHEVTQGLDEKAWRDSLQEMGINDKPTLSKPSRFDREY